MARTLGNRGAGFKAKVALAAFKGDKTLAQLAQEYGAHTTQISTWKQRLLEGVSELFEDRRRKRAAEETPVDDYRRLMEVNYLGTVHGCQAALPVMRRQGRGVIINVSSIVGHRALAGGAAYAATKAAQVSVTESLRLELRGTEIAACSIHPVTTETEFAEVAARASAGRKGGPVGPRQSAEAVARAIVACARRPRPEVYPYRWSRAVVWLNALAPGLVDWIAARATRPKAS